MGRNEIIKQLASRVYGDSRDEKYIQQCTNICDTLVEIITETLLDGEKVLWKGFVSMEVTERGKRRGRDPKDGTMKEFPPVKSVKCRVSKSIKDLINGKE